jgi:hypothetical protein
MMRTVGISCGTQRYGNPPDLKATVFFPSAGQKQLLLRFAKLEVVAE